MGERPSDPHSTPAPAASRTDRLDYAASGVDIEAGNEAVRRIKALVATTRRPEQLDGLGGFAGMMRLPTGYSEPVLVSCTDGVGTKLLIAIASGIVDTVGIDLVAMCVNDLIVTGAEPLFLLDYVATAKLAPEQIEKIVAGVVEGCRQAECALLGGETAELPGMYAPGHFDLAATAVGVAERSAIWSPEKTRAGDRVYALPSSGLHSNGYSLARKALMDPNYAGLALEDTLPGSEQSLANALLTPTRIYWNVFRELRRLPVGTIRGAANITGGGLLENPQRAVDPSLAVKLDLKQVELPTIMRVIRDQGVDNHEMLRTFNCGAGMLVYVAEDAASVFEQCLDSLREPYSHIGCLVSRGDGPEVLLDPSDLRS